MRGHHAPSALRVVSMSNPIKLAPTLSLSPFGGEGSAGERIHRRAARVEGRRDGARKSQRRAGVSGGPGRAMSHTISIDDNTHVLVLTGAGVSAESGIPTFRAGGGLWENHPVEKVASPDGFREDPELVWRFYSARRRKAITC